MSLGTYWWLSVDGPTEQAETPSKVPLAWFAPKVTVFIEITLNTLRDWIQAPKLLAASLPACQQAGKPDRKPASQPAGTRTMKFVVIYGGWGQRCLKCARLSHNVSCDPMYFTKDLETGDPNPL